MDYKTDRIVTVHQDQHATLADAFRAAGVLGQCGPAVAHFWEEMGCRGYVKVTQLVRGQK